MSMILRDDEGNEYAVVTGPLDSRVVVHLEHGDSVVRPFPTPFPTPVPPVFGPLLARAYAGVRAELTGQAVVTTEPGR
jgi:hypothetical protein